MNYDLYNVLYCPAYSSVVALVASSRGAGTPAAKETTGRLRTPQAAQPPSLDGHGILKKHYGRGKNRKEAPPQGNRQGNIIVL